MVFPVSGGTKTSQAVSAELPFWFFPVLLGPRPVKQSPVSCLFWFLFGLGSLCWSNNSSPVVSSGLRNLAKSGTLEPRAPTQETAVQILDEWSCGPSFRAGTPSILYHWSGTVSCRCLGYVILDYLSACGYIFLFTSAAGVNVPVSEYFNSTVFYMFFAFEVRNSLAFR